MEKTAARGGEITRRQSEDKESRKGQKENAMGERGTQIKTRE